MAWNGFLLSLVVFFNIYTVESGDSQLGPKIPSGNSWCDLACTTMHQDLLGALELMLSSHLYWERAGGWELADKTKWCAYFSCVGWPSDIPVGKFSQDHIVSISFTLFPKFQELRSDNFKRLLFPQEKTNHLLGNWFPLEGTVSKSCSLGSLFSWTTPFL